MLTVDNQPLVQGIPLVVGENLLAQYGHLIRNGKLVLLSDEESDINADTLGITVKLYWITD
ncbi:MAG TPA: phage baseplate plug protein [Arsenophonus sp.]